MIAYNVTLKLEPEIENEWVRWMQTEHIPEVLATALFTEYKLYKLLEQDDTDGPTYIAQYFAPTMAEYERYIQEHAPRLRQQGFDKWGNRFIAFRTVMAVVN